MKDSEFQAILGLGLVAVWYMCYWLIEDELKSFVKRFSIVPRVLIFVLGLLIAPLLAIVLVANFLFRIGRRHLQKR